MNLEMLKNPNMYVKKLSNYKTNFLINPRVLSSNNFVFPWKSYVIYDKDRENLLPNKDLPVFHNVTNTWIFNMVGLSDDVNILNPECKLRGNINASFIKKYIKKSKTDYKTYLPGKTVKWSDKEFLTNPLILSYNLFTEAHICKDNYKIEMQKEIDKFYSKLMLIHKIEKGNPYINDVDKHTLEQILKINNKYLKNKEGLYYLYIKLPKALPPFNVFHNYRNKLLDIGLLKFMTSQDRIELFALFKLLFSAEDGSEYDVFKYLDIKTLGKVHLVFELDTKITTTPLYFLISLIKGIDMPDFLDLKTTKYDRTIVAKIFYKHLLEIYKSPGFDIPAIMTNSFIETTGKEIKDDLDESEMGNKIKDIDNEDNTEINDDTINLEDVDVESESGDLLEEAEDALPMDKNEILNPDRKDSDLLKDVDAVKESLTKIESKELKKKSKKALTALEELPNKEIEINGKKVKLKDMLNVTTDELKLSDEEIKVPDSKVVFDKDYLKVPTNKFDEKYIEEIYHKDSVRTITSLARAGFIPKKINITKEESVLGDSYIHDVEYVDLVGKSHKLAYKIPVINKEGTFKLSGNTYRTRKTRVDAPIKKLTWNRVMLSSAYGKVFVEKAPLKKYDIGYKVKKELVKLADDKVLKNIVFGSVLVYDVDYPTEYSLLGRYTKSFFYKRGFYTFDYPNRKLVAHKIGIDDAILDKFEKDGKIFLGHTANKEPMFIDKNNMVHILNKNKLVEQDSLLNILNIDPSIYGYEFATIKIIRKLIPVALVLIYTLGLQNLLELLKIKYKIEDKATKDKNILSLRFSDKVVNMELTNDLQRMVMYGLTEFKKEFKTIPVKTLEDNTALAAFFMDLGYTINIVTEIKTIGPLFVDPITANILELNKEPTTFTGLLIRASELLLTDNFKHPNDTNGFRTRGYDTIHSLTYKLMIDAVKKKMGEDYFASGKVSINPYEIEKQLNTDSASVLIDDLNPVAFIKQKEDTTYVGLASGRKKESMSKNTRVFHPSEKGLISEAVKDSGDVGITAYLSSSPLIKNLRGEKDNDTEAKFVNMLSTPGMLMPFMVHDDGKRANFTQIQMAHVVPIKGSQVFPVRTGYDTILPYKLPKKYIGYATDKGKVTNVTKSEVVITYTNGEKDKFSLTKWYSKEESGSTFEFDLVPNVSKGDTVNKGDIVVYCKQWFEPDMFDSKRVAFKQGIIVKTALQEIMETYEDSCTITNKLAEKLTINPIKTRSLVITKDDRIANPILPGEQVEPSTVLMTLLGKVEGIEDKELTKEELTLLQNFVKETPKAKYEGRITKIQIFYNCDAKELNRSIKNLLNKVGDEIVDHNDGKVATGRVNSSYSIGGRPLLEGGVEIKYYIETTDLPTSGDKFVFGNPIKTTVGEVYDYPIVTENGEEVEALFSTQSIIARIVTSFMINGTTTTLLKKVTENAVDMYFK